MKKFIANLGNYVETSCLFLFLLWAWTVGIGLAIRLTMYAWGLL